jgi:hypothetical protein
MLHGGCGLTFAVRQCEANCSTDARVGDLPPVVQVLQQQRSPPQHSNATAGKNKSDERIINKGEKKIQDAKLIEILIGKKSKLNRNRKGAPYGGGGGAALQVGVRQHCWVLRDGWQRRSQLGRHRGSSGDGRGWWWLRAGTAQQTALDLVVGGAALVAGGGGGRRRRGERRWLRVGRRPRRRGSRGGQRAAAVAGGVPRRAAARAQCVAAGGCSWIAGGRRKYGRWRPRWSG